MNLFPLRLALLALLTACQASAPPLNSERIETRFGSYGVEIVEQGAGRRVTCLYSTDGGRRQCRTLAVVRFAEAVPPALAAPLAAVREGASLGATLASAGWQVEKINRYLGSYRLPPGTGSPAAAYFGLNGGEILALHIYDLAARQDGTTVSVARLLEIHDPAYLGPDDLRQIYSALPFEPLPPDLLDGWLREAARIPPP